jgi:hypothetical protein
MLRLIRAERQWAIEFNDCRHSHWASADDAVMAAVRH